MFSYFPKYIDNFQGCPINVNHQSLWINLSITLTLKEVILNKNDGEEIL
jgi:hypothetical protein